MRRYSRLVKAMVVLWLLVLFVSMAVYGIKANDKILIGICYFGALGMALLFSALWR